MLVGGDAGQSARTLAAPAFRRYTRTSIAAAALILLAFAAGYQVTRHVVWRSQLPTPVAKHETKLETPVTTADREHGSPESEAIAGLHVHASHTVPIGIEREMLSIWRESRMIVAGVAIDERDRVDGGGASQVRHHETCGWVTSCVEQQR